MNGKWYGRFRAEDSSSGSESKVSSEVLPAKSKSASKNSDDSKLSDSDDTAEIPKLFEAEYIYIEKDWSNWYLIYGENLENFLKNKKLRIEYIDGNSATAKFDGIQLEREVGFNRWKKYWKIKSDKGVITRVPETSIWRIKIVKN